MRRRFTLTDIIETFAVGIFLGIGIAYLITIL